LNREFLLPVCDKHHPELSFVKGYFRMPKHWRSAPLMVRCAQRNCTRDADHWLVIELAEDVWGKGPCPTNGVHQRVLEQSA